ncbi:polysaccharide deacetylase family protein [Parahaliea sp. F7430]|uniref:Polysaccharide deacetylase family protein n=1 Tax=Sediminihaliea albiluteola TaxID=2758564 RepID=A0A7W2YJ23_9GAMM|nr:polysaccharide deacetylase family protein [Sediminihaliea albiluteola]MBA6412700.1 polysaccharide deacetylase family protein [Sediminihaliea albiluteola]
MKQLILGLARIIGLFKLAQWLTRDRLRILAYHGIWEGDGHFGNFLFMKPATFESRMRFLNEWGATVLPLSKALELLSEKRLPEKAVVITIDDGWQSSCKHMSEILCAAGYPATLYVSSYYADKQSPVFDVALAYLFQLAEESKQAVCIQLNAAGTTSKAPQVVTLSQLQDYARSLDSDEQRQSLLAAVAESIGESYESLCASRTFHLANSSELASMSSRGIDLQLHTHRHRTRSATESSLASEISENRQWLEQLTSKPLVHFCYPSGLNEPEDWPVLKELGIESATTTDSGLARESSNIYCLPRILDGENLSNLELEAEMSGFLELVRQVISFSRLTNRSSP